MDLSRKKRVWKVLLLFLVLFVSFLFMLWLHPSCLIYEATGWYCPACGTQRLLLRLFEGDFYGAFWENPYMFCVLPLLSVYLCAESVLYSKGKPLLCKNMLIRILLGVLLGIGLLFGILRNLPGFSFLLPTP